ncbi:alpha/beta hydrolase family protein [Paenibacillus xanthanilyticus]|uniref:Alpha/beta hydrolase family protein n=1 Tax=Paenibacillus xanthanilyticus TaxID=1783531 RepID=A0ABV8K550_9BACL
MRLWEGVLLASNLALVILLLIGRPSNTKRRTMWIAAGLSVGALAVHLTMEGYRFQLFASYLAAVLLLAAWGASRNRDSKGRRVFAKTVAICSLPLLLLSGAAAQLIPVFQLPGLPGPYAVGTEIVHAVDASREDLLASQPGTKRELIIQVWYPADDSAKGKRMPFIPDGRQQLAAFADRMNLPQVTLDYLRYVKSRSYEGAAVRREVAGYPLLILNHGYGTTRLLHVEQAESLASRGYVVASIDHTYGNMATVFPDDRVAEYRIDTDRFDESAAYRDQIGKEWANDILFTLAYMEQLSAGEGPNRNFAGVIDTTRVGVLGHSFGGAASYLASADDRIKAGIDMDGTLVGFEGGEALNKPFMWLSTLSTFEMYKKVLRLDESSGAKLDGFGSTPEKYEAMVKLAKAELKHIRELMERKGEMLVAEGAEHYNFTDAPRLSPLLPKTGMTGGMKADRSARLINDVVADFFDRHLKGEPAEAKLLQTYPELEDVKSQFLSESRGLE